MSHVTLRENIKTRIEHADLVTLQSIWEIFDRSERRAIAMPEPEVGSTPNRADATTASSRPLQFVGENLTLEEFERLSPEERAMLKWRLKEKNQTWLQEKFTTLNAAWVVVVDGEVVASGKHLQNKPLPPQLLEIHRQTAKFPLVFVNDQLITIEESASAWQNTILPDDFYPTLLIIFNSAVGMVEMIGDFDTGCSHTFVDYDFLAAHRIIQSETIEDFEKHKHLNQDFVYVNKPVRVELHINSNEVRAVNTQVSCVRK